MSVTSSNFSYAAYKLNLKNTKHLKGLLVERFASESFVQTDKEADSKWTDCSKGTTNEDDKLCNYRYFKHPSCFDLLNKWSILRALNQANWTLE